MAASDDSACFSIDLQNVTLDSTSTHEDMTSVTDSEETPAGDARRTSGRSERKQEGSGRKETAGKLSAQSQHLPSQPSVPELQQASNDRAWLPASKKQSKSDDTPLLDKESLLLASTLVIDAKNGRNLTFRTEEKYIKSYILYHKFYLQWLLYFFIIFDLFLAIFEKPGIPGAEIPYWASMLLEATCLAFFLMRVLHAKHFQDSTIFWRDTKNYMVIGTIALTFIDIVCYIFWVNLAPDKHPVRWSRPLRPLFIINFSDGKQIRRAFRNIRRTVPDIMNILVLFILTVFLFALLALKLFSKRSNLIYPNGDPYFKNYGDALWDLYVLVTTANNPDVMMPAYDSSRWFAVFFIVYLIVCLYIFMSIVLAAIYNNYKKNLRNEIRAAVYSKRQKLSKAFEIIKVDLNGRGAVTPNRWMQVMKVVKPNKSTAHLELLRKVLDTKGDDCIYKEDFMNLTDLLNVKLTEVVDRQTFLEKKMPKIYNSRLSNLVKEIVKQRVFRYIFDLLIFINAFIIAFDVNNADWFFLVAFTIEIILKLYVFGPHQFFFRLWNVFDFFVIGAALIVTIIERAIGETSKDSSILDILLVLRVLRLFKLFGSIKRFKVVILTILNIGPSITTYGGVMFVFYYFFAIIGMELFQGLIRYNENATAPENFWCGNLKLQNSTFSNMRYCGNNFNDLLHSFVLLFELTVVNQWHGFVQVTSKVARLYFFSFHLCCVVIVLNIFTAFILEAFILEYSLYDAPKLESSVEAKIKQLGLGLGMKQKPTGKTKMDKTELVLEEQPPGQHQANQDESSDSDTDSIPDTSQEIGLRFHLRRRNRKKVEVLLQQMFQAEIAADDIGPEQLTENSEVHRPERKLTFESI